MEKSANKNFFYKNFSNPIQDIEILNALFENIRNDFIISTLKTIKISQE